MSASAKSPVAPWTCPPKSEADATNWSAPLLMPAAALSTDGPAAFTDAVTESIAFEEALMASPVFFPMSFPASFMPAALVSEYLENASAAAFEAWALFAERALPASWAAARAASALAAEPACGNVTFSRCEGGRRTARVRDRRAVEANGDDYGKFARILDEDTGAAPAGSARSDEGLLLLAQLAPWGLKRVTSATAGATKQHTTADRIFDEFCVPFAA